MNGVQVYHVCLFADFEPVKDRPKYKFEDFGNTGHINSMSVNIVDRKRFIRLGKELRSIPQYSGYDVMRELTIAFDTTTENFGVAVVNSDQGDVFVKKMGYNAATGRLKSEKERNCVKIKKYKFVGDINEAIREFCRKG